MLFAGGFSFANFLMDVLTLFAFVIWFWLPISICGDLFRRALNTPGTLAAANSALKAIKGDSALICRDSICF